MTRKRDLERTSMAIMPENSLKEKGLCVHLFGCKLTRFVKMAQYLDGDRRKNYAGDIKNTKKKITT